MTRDEASLLSIVVALMLVLMWWSARRLRAEPCMQPWKPRNLLRLTAGLAGAIAGVASARYFLDGQVDWTQALDLALGGLGAIGVLALWGALWQVTQRRRREPTAGNNHGGEEAA